MESSPVLEGGASENRLATSDTQDTLTYYIEFSGLVSTELAAHFHNAGTRDNGPVLAKILYWFAIAFAFYHIYTAGFGTPADHEHMGVHLAGLFIMIFAAILASG